MIKFLKRLFASKKNKKKDLKNRLTGCVNFYVQDDSEI